jgi:DNA-binding transcriptional LysR family regulator
MLINEMIIFVHVVQLKSFSHTAQKLAVSKSMVSKSISKLEKDLKTNLLRRSTRQISLTAEGEVFYQHCQTLLACAQQGYTAVENLHKQPTGTLKISVPPALAMHVLAQPVIHFSQRYPEVKLNVILESHIVDIIQQGYDLALRSALLPDSSLVGQKIATLRNVLCATPAYLKKQGTIKHPNQLSQHIFAVYSNKNSLQKFKFNQGKQSFAIQVNGHFQSNNLDFLTQLVMADQCIAVLPDFMVTTAIAKKKLVVCLPQYRIPDSPLYAIYPKREFVPLRVKMFIELLKTQMNR